MSNNYLDLIKESFDKNQFIDSLKSVKSENYFDEFTKIIQDVSDLDSKLILSDELEYCESSEFDKDTTIRRLKDTIMPNKSMKESVMTPTGKNNNIDAEPVEPMYIFVFFGKDHKCLLNKHGPVIQNKAENKELEEYAADWFRLIPYLEEVYAIGDEEFDAVKDIRDDDEYYKFIKANGTLIKRPEKPEKLSDDAPAKFEFDEDFLDN